MQIDDEDGPNYSTSGSTIELTELHGENYQKWQLIHVMDGCYKIVSIESGMVATAPSSVDAVITQTTYAGNGAQLWKITSAGGGLYRLSPKSNPSYYMAVDSNSSSVKMRASQSDNKDEWLCIRMLPTNGYEIPYSPSAWLGYAENCCNCYAYALNNQVYPETNYLWFKQQMGLYGGLEYSELVEENIYNAVKRDYNEYNDEFGRSLFFERIGRYDICPAGTYKVALTASNNDYHWYRQDADGLWSHKQGTLPVTRTDNSGNLIIDPSIADRGSYVEFLGYYAVTPWNETLLVDGTVYCYFAGYILTYTELMNLLASRQGAQTTGSSWDTSTNEIERLLVDTSVIIYEKERNKTK